MWNSRRVTDRISEEILEEFSKNFCRDLGRIVKEFFQKIFQKYQQRFFLFFRIPKKTFFIFRNIFSGTYSKEYLKNFFLFLQDFLLKFLQVGFKDFWVNLQKLCKKFLQRYDLEFFQGFHQKIFQGSTGNLLKDFLNNPISIFFFNFCRHFLSDSFRNPPKLLELFFLGIRSSFFRYSSRHSGSCQEFLQR